LNDGIEFLIEIAISSQFNRISQQRKDNARDSSSFQNPIGLQNFVKHSEKIENLFNLTDGNLYNRTARKVKNSILTATLFPSDFTYIQVLLYLYEWDRNSIY